MQIDIPGHPQFLDPLVQSATVIDLQRLIVKLSFT